MLKRMWWALVVAGTVLAGCALDGRPTADEPVPEDPAGAGVSPG
jgi:hypothetical protein